MLGGRGKDTRLKKKKKKKLSPSFSLHFLSLLTPDCLLLTSHLPRTQLQVDSLPLPLSLSLFNCLLHYSCIRKYACLHTHTHTQTRVCTQLNPDSHWAKPSIYLSSWVHHQQQLQPLACLINGFAGSSCKLNMSPLHPPLCPNHQASRDPTPTQEVVKLWEGCENMADRQHNDSFFFFFYFKHFFLGSHWPKAVFDADGRSGVFWLDAHIQKQSACTHESRE